MRARRSTIPALLLCLATPLWGQDQAALRLAPVFGDHMVLPRERPVTVWGRATPGQSVEVQLGDDQGHATADAEGRWSATLPARPASAAGVDLVVRRSGAADAAAIVVRDVLLGDVWLCTGQSNMRWRVRESAEAADVLEGAEVPNLRLLDLAPTLAPTPKRYPLPFLEQLRADNFYSTSGWRPANAASAATFSAVAFSFGRRLALRTRVPIGLVLTAVGGAPMEAFVAERREDWLGDPRYPRWCAQRVRENLAAWFERPSNGRPRHPFEPGFLFAAGVAPLRELAIKGIVFYQGESDATDTATSSARDPARNEATLRRLIQGLRAHWRQPELPFHFVQLPGIRRDWESFREVQDVVARTTPGCELVVTLDLGDPNDVHPRRKRPVGQRLANSALAHVYGDASVAVGGPRFARVDAGDGALRAAFTGSRSLRTRDHQPARGFWIAGEDRVFHAATAHLSGLEATVRAAEVPEPVAVRYAYEDDPDANLVGAEGLPLAPFRTDDWQDAQRAAQAGRESFEGGEVGPLREHRGPLGVWRAAQGHAEITSHFAHDGARCLHIEGGADRQVELSLPSPTPRSLRFFAERWTRRAPFSFRVEARRGGAWREVFDGDDVQVGARFLSEVAFVIPEGSDRLRFGCTSPAASGLLLDDFEATAAAPMRVTAVTRVPWRAPMLRGRFSVADRVRLRSRGDLEPRRVVACRAAIPASAIEHIEGVRALGQELQPSETLTFRGEVPLRAGDLDLDLEVRWRADAPWEAARNVTIRAVTLDGGEAHPVPDGDLGAPRLATAVRSAGEDGVHTTRIPGLVTTNEGTLIAVYDNRYKSSKDLPGDVDVGMSRSTDGGLSWSPMRPILDMGDDPAWRHDGVGDPAALVDRETGRVWVAATWSHGDRSWNGSGPGMRPEETGQLMLTHSDDDGLTWSPPTNITAQVKDPSWRFVLQGPGRGITTEDGTLVFAAQFRSAPDGPYEGKPFSTILWSKDRGASWHIGAGVKVDTTESQVVELGGGELMLNCRDNRGGSRSIYTTRDLGATWSRHPTSRSALVEPVCMASLLRVDHEDLGPLLLFSNPATAAGRFDMSVKVSRDLGATWPAALRTLYDQRKGFGYSCLTRIDRDHVGVLYEGQRELYFVRFALRDLVR